MIMTLLRFIFVLFAAALFTATSVQAHKIRVFAYESGGMIFTEVKFSNGRPAQNTQVVVEGKDGSSILSGTTDKSGIFQFAIPQEALNQKPDLKIIADVGEGHRGSWLLEAADYLAIGSPQKGVTEEPESPPSTPRDAPAKNSPAASDYRALEERVEEIIRQELLPIKRILAQEKEKKLTLQDILGGLGYIFGLAGIAAYYKSKKNGEKS